MPRLDSSQPLNEPAAPLEPGRPDTGHCDHEVEELNRRLRQTQDDLQAALKLASLGRLAAEIAHEMSTPAQFVGDNLTFLLESCEELWSYLDSLEKGGAPPSRPSSLDDLRKEIPEALESSQEGMNRVVRILHALRHCASCHSTEMVVVSLEEIVQDCLALSAGQWKYLAKVETRFARDLPPVRCVRADLAGVVLNFLLNASHSIRSKGTVGIITIRTARRSTFAELTIEDDGCGIAEHLQPNLFDPYINTRPAGQGGGHELQMARRVVEEQHSGKLSFYSSPGQGTRFVMQLPLA